MFDKIKDHNENGVVLFNFMALSLSELYRHKTDVFTMMFEWDHDTFLDAQDFSAYHNDFCTAQEADQKAREASRNPTPVPSKF